MSTIQTPAAEKIRQEWLARLDVLIHELDGWATKLGWSTRQFEKRMEESQIGTYQAPALLMQQETTRLLIEPIASSAPGAEGVVDLYLMPAYDDVASLYYHDGDWHLHYMFPGTPGAPGVREAVSQPLTEKTFSQVLDEMKKDAV